jgi:hypothetical protein
LDSTDPDRRARELLKSLGNLLAPFEGDLVLIGGLAVNLHRRPRFTDDLDFLTRPGPEYVGAVVEALEGAGYVAVKSFGEHLPSGPDFVQFASEEAGVHIDVTTSKTDLQDSVIERALMLPEVPGIRVATLEDLILLKLIANRHQDQSDVVELAAKQEIDWQYVERWVPDWDLADRLRNLRDWLEHDRQIEKDLGL